MAVTQRDTRRCLKDRILLWVVSCVCGYGDNRRSLCFCRVAKCCKPVAIHNVSFWRTEDAPSVNNAPSTILTHGEEEEERFARDRSFTCRPDPHLAHTSTGPPQLSQAAHYFAELGKALGSSVQACGSFDRHRHAQTSAVTTRREQHTEQCKRRSSWYTKMQGDAPQPRCPAHPDRRKIGVPNTILVDRSKQR